MNDKERVKAFLTELTALTDKYNITICGCGCCGSPWLDVNNGATYDNLQYKDSAYQVDNNYSSNEEYYKYYDYIIGDKSMNNVSRETIF